MCLNICEKYDFVNDTIVLRPTEPDEFGSIQPPEALRTLSTEEETLLTGCEQVVDEHRDSFFKAASALLTLHSQKLYLKTHITFHAYVQERFGFQRSQAYRIMNAARLLNAMSPSGDIDPKVTEGQLRKVAELPDVQKEAVIDEIKQSGQTVTPVLIKHARQKHAPAVVEKDARAASKRRDNPTGITVKPAVTINHLKNQADQAVALFESNSQIELGAVLKDLQAGLTSLSLQNN